MNALKQLVPLPALALAAIGLACGGAAAQEDAKSEVETTQAALEQWVATRRVLSQEKRDWAIGREVLNDRIDLVQREIDSLRQRISDAKESISEADEKTVELQEENERLKQASASLQDTIEKLEVRTRELLVRLPDPIRQSERVAPLGQRIPEAGKETKLSLGERFQNVVGLLNEVNKFNREITLTSERRTLGDGTTAEVTAFYVGISHGFYVNAKGDAAGVGTASADGWTWQPADAAAPAIVRAIAILKNEQIADFVELPVTVQ